jgi:phospholipid/cholesterol/gamma-HCH transport system ATP-binding protein
LPLLGTVERTNGIAVELHGVRKSLGGKPVIKGVSCVVPPGSITALIGPSGAGKTTLMRLLLGVTQPDSGRVIVDGEDITKLSIDALNAVRSQVGVLIEGPGALFSSMTVFDNVAFPLRQVRHLSEPAVEAEAMRLLDEVGLGNDAAKMPDQLSFGMRVRAAYARAMAMEPRMLIFDSPDYGMDAVRLTLLFQLLAHANATRGCTALVLTHDIKAVFPHARHAILLRDGEVIEQGSPAELQRSSSAFTQQFIHGLMAGPMKME